MGKGARTRIKYAEEQKAVSEQQAVQKKTKKKHWIIGSAIALVLAIAIAISGCLYASYYSSGKYLRETVVATSDSTTVDNAMMLYYFNQTYQTYKNYYGDYFSTFTGVDTEKSLKTQTTSDGTTTWFDSFMTSTKTALTELMLLNDEAQKNGVTLTDKEKETIHDRAQQVENPSAFGAGLNNDDIERALLLSYTASKYKSQLRNSYDVSDSDIDSYYEENHKTFETVAYRSYNINYSDDEIAAESSESSTDSSSETSTDTSAESSTDSEASTTKTLNSVEAKYYSVQFMGSDTMTEEDYIAKVTEIMKDINPDISDDDLTSSLDSTVTTGASYTADDEVSEWLFDDSRAVGNTYVFDDADNKRYTVYYLISLPERSESMTYDCRHILLTADTYGSDDEAKAKAEEILAQWESGDKSEDSFAELALQYTEDTGSEFTGGLYQNIKEGEMETNFNDWLFDSSRKEGDYEIISTSHGYHIMYFVGNATPQWKASVNSAIRSEKYSSDYTTISEADTVTFNEDKFDDLKV